jgi:hypothetical protein
VRRYWLDGEQWEHTVTFLVCEVCAHVEVQRGSRRITPPPEPLEFDVVCPACSDGLMFPANVLWDDPP